LGAKTTPLQDVLPWARKPRPYKMFCLGRENRAPTRCSAWGAKSAPLQDVWGCRGQVFWPTRCEAPGV